MCNEMYIEIVEFLKNKGVGFIVNNYEFDDVIEIGDDLLLICNIANGDYDLEVTNPLGREYLTLYSKDDVIKILDRII